MGDVIELRPVREDGDMSGAALRTLLPYVDRLKTLAAKAVWQQLAISHVHGHGQIIRTSVAQLARDLDVKRDTVYRAIDEIEAAALATRRPKHGDFILWITLENEGTADIHRSPVAGQGGVPWRDMQTPHGGTPSSTKNLKEGVVPLFSVDKSR